MKRGPTPAGMAGVDGLEYLNRFGCNTSVRQALQATRGDADYFDRAAEFGELQEQCCL